MRRSVKLVAGIVGGLTLVLVTVVGWLALAPRHVPPGQPSLRWLDASELQAVRETFNASPDAVRVLVLLSPT